MNADYFFLHIPKTAGTSVRVIIRQTSPPGAVLENKPFLAMLKRGAVNLPAQGVVCGHLPGDLSPYLANHPPEFTFLREPVSRCISQYRHQRRFHGDALLQHGVAIRDFSQTIRHPDMRHYFHNLQARFLAYQGPVGDKSILFGFHPPEDELEAMAKARLERMVCVGTLERFGESVGLLARRLGWGEVDTGTWVNRADNIAKVEELPQADLDYLAEANAVDQRLYAHGQALLARQLDAASASIDGDADRWMHLQQQGAARLSLRLRAVEQELEHARADLQRSGVRLGTWLQRLADRLMPIGSARRAAVRRVYRSLRPARTAARPKRGTFA